MWWSGTINQPEFLQAAHMSGLTQWSDHQCVQYNSNGIPAILSNHYYTLKSNGAEFARSMVADLEKVSPPWFVAIYGGSPHAFHEVAQGLPPERFKIVKLDEFFSAAVKCRDKMEGRVWSPAPGGPKGVRP
jgi:hypothetical protein